MLNLDHVTYLHELYEKGLLYNYLNAFQCTIMPSLDENSNVPVIIKGSLRKYIKEETLYAPTKKNDALMNTKKRKNVSFQSQTGDQSKKHNRGDNKSKNIKSHHHHQQQQQQQLHHLKIRMLLLLLLLMLMLSMIILILVMRRRIILLLIRRILRQILKILDYMWVISVFKRQKNH